MNALGKIESSVCGLVNERFGNERFTRFAAALTSCRAVLCCWLICCFSDEKKKKNKTTCVLYSFFALFNSKIFCLRCCFCGRSVVLATVDLTTQMNHKHKISGGNHQQTRGDKKYKKKQEKQIEAGKLQEQQSNVNKVGSNRERACGKQ